MVESSKNHGMLISRVLDAPRERVWRAWTDPAMVGRWWGPKDFTSDRNSVDLRVGGRYHFLMIAPDGQEYWTTGTYREIVPPERLVYTDSFANEKGDVISPSEFGFPPDFPLESVVTVTFEDVSGRTRLTVMSDYRPEGEFGEMAEMGWLQQLDKFAAVVESETANLP